MSDKKPSANIIQGPWKNRKIIIPEIDETRQLADDIMFANDLTEEIIVNIVHGLSENGINIDNKGFVKNLGFLVETLKATIYTELDLSHELNILIDAMTNLKENDDKQLESSLNLETLEELVEFVESLDDE
jgi:hypothetical protein